MFSYRTSDLHHRTRHRKLLAVLLMAAVVLYALISFQPLYAQGGSITITQQVDGYDDGRTFDFVVSTAADVTTPPTFVEQLATGEVGDATQVWQSPRIAIDAAGYIYAANSNYNRIEKFDPAGTLLLQWGEAGNGQEQLQYPSDIAVDVNGNVYVADTFNHRIQVFDAAGTYIAQWGGEGNGDGQFKEPEGIEIDANGNIYVADTDNHRIQVFDATGAYIEQWGTEGSGDGQLYFPSDIAFDSGGNIYIADIGNFRIQKFDASGAYLLKWGEYGTDPGLFGDGHLLLAIDSSDNIFVADPPSRRVHKFDSSGNLIAHLGDYSVGDGHFDEVSGIAIDQDDNIYFSNTRYAEFPEDVDPMSYDILKYVPATIDTPVSGLTSGQSHTLAELNGAPYRITQVAQDGMPLDGVSCDGGVSSESIENGIAIELNGESVTCTFTNHNVNAGQSVRLDNLQRPATPPSSRYRITNLSDQQVMVTQTLYDTSRAKQYDPATWELNTGQKFIFDLADFTPEQFWFLEGEFSGYADITSDQNILVTRLPSAHFEISPSAGTEQLAKTFTSSTLGTINGWLWDFGDGSTSTEANPTHIYAAEGTYSITLTVTDVSGESHSVTKSEYIASNEQYAGRDIRIDTIQKQSDGPSSRYKVTNLSASTNTIEQVFFNNDDMEANMFMQDLNGGQTVFFDLADRSSEIYQYIEQGFDGYLQISSLEDVLVTLLPSASFDVIADREVAPVEMTFTSSTLGNVTDWQWDFGDGNTSTEITPTHSYAAEGTYTVTLTVTDVNDENYSVSKPAYATVGEVYIGKSIQLNNIQWRNSGPSTRYRITNLENEQATITQTFGDTDGNPHSWNTLSLDAGSSLIIDLKDPDYSFADIEADGSVELTSDKMILAQILPTAYFNVTTSETGSRAIQFTPSTLGNITDWHWDFGDGNSSTDLEASHTYSATGTYTATLTTTDAQDNSHSYSKHLQITNLESYFGKTIRLENIQRLLNEPSSRYRITNLVSDSNSVEQAFYENNGGQDYLRSQDIGGGQSLVVDLSENLELIDHYVDLGFRGYVEINSTEDVVVTRLPSAIFDATQTLGPTPLEVTFTASILGSVTDWLWDFGDGNTSTEITPTYTYTTGGKQTVTLTVSDNGSETHTVSKPEYIDVTDASTIKTQVSGLIAESTQWTIDGSPYLVTGPLLVDTDATLTIDPGVEVRFMAGLSMDVAGTLVAIGTEDQPILFTSTDSDPVAGAWSDIRFLDGSQGTLYDEVGDYYDGSILRHVEIAYAGGRAATGDFIPANYAIDAPSTTLLVDQSYFHDIDGGSIRTGGNQSRITNSRFISNTLNTSAVHDSNGHGVFAVIDVGGNNVIVSGNEIVNTHAYNEDDSFYSSTVVILSNGNDVVIENNQISSSKADANTSVPGAVSSDGLNVTIQGNQVQGTGSGLRAVIGGNSVIASNQIQAGSGISVQMDNRNEDVFITNNEVIGGWSGITLSDGTVTMYGNRISDSNTGLELFNINGQIYQNSITDNVIGIAVGTNGRQLNEPNVPNITLNNIYGNTDYNLRNDYSLNDPRLNAVENWWGTTDLTEIAAGIYDWNDNAQKGIVNFEPILTAMPDPDAVPDEVTGPTDGAAKPLVLIYAVLDNNLGESWTRLVNNIEAGATDDVNVRLLIDGPADDGDAYVYDIIGGNDPFCPSLLNPTCDGRYTEGTNFWEFGTEDTAHPTSLYQFLTDAHTAYPNATLTAVSLIGHGSGWSANVLPGQPTVWQDQNDTLGGMLWDDHPQPGVANSNSLSTLALGSALEWATAASGKRIDLLYLDGCSMGMAEVAYELRNSTDYLLSSPNIDWASFNYNNLLPEVASQTDARALGQRWLESEAAELRNNPGHPFTLALIDISQMDSLADAVSTLGSALQNALPTDRAKIADAFSAAERFDSNFDGVLDDTDNYIDLADFAVELQTTFPALQHASTSASTVVPTPPVRDAAIQVQNAMGAAVVTKDFEGGVPWVYSDQTWEWESFGGLGVYLPLGVDEVRRQLFYNQTNLTWASDTYWDEFLNDFWSDVIRAANVATMPVCQATTDGCEGLANQLPEQSEDTNMLLFLPITAR